MHLAVPHYCDCGTVNTTLFFFFPVGELCLIPTKRKGFFKESLSPKEGQHLLRPFAYYLLYSHTCTLSIHYAHYTHPPLVNFRMPDSNTRSRVGEDADRPSRAHHSSIRGACSLIPLECHNNRASYNIKIYIFI